MNDETEKTAVWGYSKKEDKIFQLAEGEELPEGFYRHPAMVPGSKAAQRQKEDAEREGVEVVLK